MDTSTGTRLSSRLEIFLLGRFEVRIDGHILPETAIKGRKARSLLKLIAQQRHYQVAREYVMNVIWPELDADAASAQLYKAIHHIRKAFAGRIKEASDWIEIGDNLIRIVPPGGLVTDVQRFEQTAREGLRGDNRSKLELASTIYTGDFLPMERYTEWASLPREHYRQLYLDVLTALAKIYEQKGELSDAAELLRLALEMEPTLETAHRGLMRIFAMKGQSTRAFHQYDLCREVLREELGMSPTPETRKTLDDIREGRLAGKQVQVPHRSSEPGPSIPLIGRDNECSIIDRVLNNLTEGCGGVLAISGEAGIGKTRHVQELILRSRRKEISFYMGRSGGGAGSVAYGPFIGLLNDILNERPELEATLPVEIRRLIPGRSGVGQPVPHADKLAAKGYLFAQVHHLLSELSNDGDGAVIIILEDMHTADQGTLDLFSYLIQHRGDLPVLFIATLLSDEGESINGIKNVLQDHSVEIIELSPLPKNDMIHLIHLDSTKAGLTEDTAERIIRLSGGNPLYALEFLNFYKDEDLLDPMSVRKVNKGVLTNGTPEKIPPSLHHIVDKKLEELSPPAHHLLYIAAVIGQTVPYELLASIWGDGENPGGQELFDALEEVIRARLLEERGLDFSFRHILFRETIYAAISEARRRALHGLAARRLVEISGDSGRNPVEQIAYHFIRAGETLTGADYLVKAAQLAEGAYAHDDALEHYREVYEVLDGVDEKPARILRCEVLERTGDVYRACGRLEKSYSAYEEALSLAEDDHLSHHKLVELYRKMAVVAIFRTEIDRSELYLEKAFELSGDDSREQARLLITKALHLWHLNRLEDAFEIAQKALKLARDADAKSEASQACEILAMTCLPLGRWQEGLEYEMERHIHGWSPEIVVATDAHLCLWEYHVSGDQPLQQASSFMEQVARQAAEFGDLRCVAVCHYALGTMHLWRGQRHKAVEELATSLDLHERVGSPAGMAYSLARKSVLHTLMGATELGWRAVQDGLSYAGMAAVRDHCLQRLYGVGIWNRLAADDFQQASELVGKSEKLLVESGACAACALELYPWLAYFHLKSGEIDRAKECGEAVRELAEKTGNPIGKSIAAMVESSLCITEQDNMKADQRKRESFSILEDAIPDTTHSPIAHFLERMVEQQEVLNHG